MTASFFLRRNSILRCVSPWSACVDLEGGVGEIGAGVRTLPVKIQTIILHIFIFFTKNSPRTPPHPPRANNNNYSCKMNSCTWWIWGTYSYVSFINLNTAILIAVGMSICFVSFDNFPFIFLMAVWLFVRIAFIQYVNVWKSLILVIFKREKTIKYYRLNKRCVLVSK